MAFPFYRRAHFFWALLGLCGLAYSPASFGENQTACYQGSKNIEQVRKIYKARGGETLAKIAYLLYGHRSWGGVILEQNLGLKRYGTNRKLPQNTLINYLGPQIGESYLVQPNDILSRIAEWKYGRRELWTKILAENSVLLNDPNRIYPGQCLVFQEKIRIGEGNTSPLSPGVVGPTPPQAAPELRAEPSGPACNITPGPLSLTTKAYKTHSGETWENIAFLLYGHRSWKNKLLKQNPKLKKYVARGGPPANLWIQYEGPEVGNAYVVRRNDILSRIAEWKYGASDEWHKIAAGNAARINDPNLIFPGDCLVFDERGNIKNLNTDKVLVSAAVVAAPTPPKDPGSPRKPASFSPPDSINIIWFLGGALGFLALAFFWFKKSSAARFDRFSHMKSTDMPFDAGMARSEEIEFDNVPNYHSLLTKWRKFLILMQKRLKMRR